MPKQTFFNLPEEKREHILDVAIQEFAAQGYRHASISHMVAEAHIAKGSFYQYFEDKEDLYEHIIHVKIAEKKMEGFKREKAKLSEMNLTQFLRIVFQGLMEDFLQSPEIVKISMELVQMQDDPVYERIMGRYQGIADTFYLDFITHEIEQGEIDGRVNVRLLNFMLVSVGRYMSHLLTVDKVEITSALIDTIVDDMEFILTNGIYTGKESG